MEIKKIMQLIVILLLMIVELNDMKESKKIIENIQLTFVPLLIIIEFKEYIQCSIIPLSTTPKLKEMKKIKRYISDNLFCISL